jgi:hypothetical protein
LFLTEQEYAERVKRGEQTLRQAYNASGAQTGGRDGAWRGNVTFRLSSQIVDPPNGRMPAVTAEAAKRRASRDRGSFGEGPFNTFDDFTLYESLHHPRDRRIDPAGAVRERQSDAADARFVRDQLRDDPRHAHRAGERPSARRGGAPPVSGGLARALEREHAGHRDDELLRP